MALNASLKLMAPITPFITEEIYYYYFREREGTASIHTSEWPSLDLIDEEAEKVGDLFVEVLAQVRKAKSEASKSMKEPVKRVLVKGKISDEQFDSIRDDLTATTKAEKIEFEQLSQNSEIDSEVIVDLE